MIPVWKYTSNEIYEAIEKSRERLEGDMANLELKSKALIYSRAINVLEEYFIKRPQKFRLVVICLFSASSLFLAFIWYIRDIYSLGLAAYCVIILNIVISEAVVNYWRLVRDNDLRPIETELEELNRNEKDLNH